MGSRIQDPIPEWTTHLAVIHKDGTVHAGPKEDLLPAVLSHQKSTPNAQHYSVLKHGSNKVLVDMQDLNVSYGDRKVSALSVYIKGV